MSRISAYALIASISILAFSPIAALAASSSEKDCTAQGGTFEKATKTCTVSTTENVGKSTNSQTTTTTTNTDYQSSPSNPHTTQTSSCSGPGSSTSSAHCK
jgi:hypothetical protein